MPPPPLQKNMGGKKQNKKKKQENKKYQPANRMHTCHRRERAAVVPEFRKREEGKTERRIPKAKNITFLTLD